VLEHGIETGVIKRLPHGEFIELHQPLSDVDSHGHRARLDYQGTPVPKRMNQLGLAGQPVAGSLLTPDPSDETAALARAHAAYHPARDGQTNNSHGQSTDNGHTDNGHSRNAPK
jgi:ubiquinol-cytochrome c reductase cytochrome b subunit